MPHARPRIVLIALLVAFGAVVATPRHADAAVVTWTGGGASGNWSDAGNWSGGTFPTTGSTVFFNLGATQKTMTDDLGAGGSNLSLGGMTFNDTGYQLATGGGRTLTLTGGLTISAAVPSGSDTFNSALTVTASPWSVQVLTTGTAFVFNAPITDVTGNINVTGPGNFDLFANSTFTGILTADGPSQAVLAVTGNDALGAGAIVIGNGAEIFVQNNTTVPNAITLNGNGPGGGGAIQTVNGNSTETFSGPMTLGSATTIDDNNSTLGVNLVLSGPIGGTGPLTLDTSLGNPGPTGVITVSGTGSYTGGTVVHGSGSGPFGGVVHLSNNGALATGAINIDGKATLELADVAPWTNALTMNGATLAAATTIVNWSGSVNLTGGANTLKAPLGNVLDITGVATGGAVALTGGGAVWVDSNSPGVIPSASGGVGIGGNGTVGNASLTGAFLSPGHSPGLLSVGALTIDSSSRWIEEIAGPVAGTQYDQVATSGAVNLGGAQLQLSLSFTPTAGQDFTILRNTGGAAITGTFAGLPEGATITAANATFTITYRGNAGNDVVLRGPAIAVPSVGTVAIANPPFGWGEGMLGAGVALLALTLRRRPR